MKIKMGVAIFLKVLGVVFLLSSTSIVILGDEDVPPPPPPPPEDPCEDCMDCKDCGRHCLTSNCTDCEEVYFISRSCVIAAMIGAGISVPLAPMLLWGIGFTGVGVTAGSLAALWQSTMAGIVAKGGIFAFLQSLAMGGFSFFGATLVTGAVGFALYTFCDKLGSLTGFDMKCYSQINCK